MIEALRSFIGRVWRSAPPAAPIVPCEGYLYEFLWRGRAPGDPAPPAWHVAIETRLDAGGGHVVPHVRTLNVAQAIAEGWDLQKIGKEIGMESLAEIEAARAAIDAHETTISEQHEAARLAAAQLQAQGREIVNLKAAFEDRRQAADQLAIEREDHRAAIRDLVRTVDEQTAVVKALQERLAQAETAPGGGKVRRGAPYARR